MTKETEKKKRPATIQEILNHDGYLEQIRRALPAHLTPERMARLALTECRRTPELLECNPVSLFAAIIQGAQLGLELGGVLGQCWLIPRWNKNKGYREVQFMIGYMGMISLARRSGEILSLSARAIFEGDEFDYQYGTEEFLVHKPKKESGGKFIGAYAYAALVGGGHQYEVMWEDEINAIRGRSATAKDGPWVTDYIAMVRKTMVRQIFKWVPRSIEMQTAAALDDCTILGKSQDIEREIFGAVLEDEEGASREPETRTEKVKKSLNAIEKKEINTGKLIENIAEMGVEELGIVEEKISAEERPVADKKRIEAAIEGRRHELK